MTNYKEMYFTLFRATEQAINALIAAQQKCEDLYLNTDSDSVPNEAESGECTKVRT